MSLDLRKCIFFLILLFSIHNICFSQHDNREYLLFTKNKFVKLNRKNKTNATYIVNELIKGKTNDLEKFNAIFMWVTTNIKYNNSEFYLPTHDLKKQISKILKTKRTICLGYANLMDTLCSIANIKSTTIYGYAKSFYSDVGDSIYGHNHAWNAVKLDGLWYVYDATWSKGKFDYKLNFLTKKVLKWHENHPVKYRKKKIKWPKNKNICNIDKKQNKIYQYRPKITSIFLHKLLAKLPIYGSKKFVKGISKDYYLSEPNVFSITHIPDDPIWTLESEKSIQHYENDSLLYYFNDSILKNQSRFGVQCQKCDDYLELPIKSRIKILHENSKAFNLKNKYISVLCNEQLGNINKSQSLLNASITDKIKFLDSAIINYSNAITDFQKASKNNNTLAYLDKKKNKNKLTILQKENKLHLTFISKKINTTIQKRRNFLRMTTQGISNLNNYYKYHINIKSLIIKINSKHIKPLKDSKILAIKSVLQKNNKILDSLNILIKNNQDTLNNILENLKLNVWHHVKGHDSILYPFKKCIQLRRNGKDGYKKGIVDTRKTIPYYENKYSNTLNNIVFKPCDQTYTLYKEITHQIKLKQKAQKLLLLNNKTLHKGAVLDYDFLNNYKNEILKDSEHDYCWLLINYLKIVSVQNGLLYLEVSQKEVNNILNIENHIERKRFSVINQSIKESYRITNSHISLNTLKFKLLIKETQQKRKELTERNKH